MKQNIVGLGAIIVVIGALQAFNSPQGLASRSASEELALNSLNQGEASRATSAYLALRAGTSSISKVGGHAAVQEPVEDEEGGEPLEPLEVVFNQVAEGMVSYRPPEHVQLDAGRVANLCNPYSRSCRCHEAWSGSKGLCDDLESYVKLGRRSNVSIGGPPVVRLSIPTPGVVETGGWHRCEESLCYVHNAHDSSADGFLKPCADASIPERRVWQEVVVSGMGEGEACEADRALGYPGVDAWAGERAHVDTQLHIYTSWVDAPPAFFELAPPPLSERHARALLPEWAVDAAGDADVLALSAFLPVVSADGSRVLSKGEAGPGPALQCKPLEQEAQDEVSTGRAVRTDPTRVQRRCGLYRHPFLLIPSGASRAVAAAAVQEALQMGTIPVLLARDSPLAPLDDLPDPSSAIRLDDFGSLAELGGYLQSLLQAGDKGLAKHLSWKSDSSRWSEGFVRQLRQQRGNLVCRVCDHVARRREANMAKVVSRVPMLQRPAPASIAHCVADVLQKGWFWEVNGAAVPRLPRVDQIYVVHYTRLSERRDHIIELVKQMNLGPALIMASHDREELSDDDISCFHRDDPEFPMVSGQYSLAIKHFMAYLDMIQRGYESVLVIEDDIVLSDVSPQAYVSHSTPRMSIQQLKGALD